MSASRRLLMAVAAVLAMSGLAVIPGPASDADSFRDSAGSEFWLTFPSNYGGPQLTLFITSSTDATGTVEIPGLGFSQAFSVVAADVTSVAIPSGAHLTTNGVVEDLGIHVVADAEVTVYGLSRQLATTDAYLGLPTEILGTDYVVLGHKNVNIVNGSELAVVGTVDGTTVTITPSATAAGHPAGTPFTVALDEGQTYQLIATGAAPADLSGTEITADQPIAVFGGHRCANVPDSTALYCDHIVEQLTPTDTWGTRFGTVPLATRLRGDTFRVVAAHDGTELSVNGAVVATLDRGQVHQQIIAGPAEITATLPVLVAQYSNGSTYDNVTSDPFMMLVPPLDQFLTAYTLSTPPSGFRFNFVNVVVPDTAVGQVAVDGTPIPASQYQPIGTTGYSGAQVAVSVGSHRLTGPGDAFGAFSYGFDSYDSYGYPGGMAIRLLCGEDGLDALHGTPAEGLASAPVHDVLEPTVGGVDVALGDAVHNLNCDTVVAAENAIDGVLGS